MARRLDIRVTVPDLRNGDPATIVQAAPRASIPAQYKWAHIRDMSPADYVVYVDAVIRAQYAQVLTAAGANATDAQKAEARVAAVILGSVRAGAAAAFNLRNTDLNAEEVVGTGSEFTPARPAQAAVGAPGDEGHVAAVAARDAAVGTIAGTAGGNHTVATAMDELTDDEVTVVNTLIYLGMSVPAMQGASLTLSGHHFLPTTRNCFEGMLKQARQAGGDTVNSWVDARGESFYDWAFHKACHPILPVLKRAWAKNPATAERLVASGHGAAAIRIPTLPPDGQAGKAGLAVMRKAAPVVRAMSHTIATGEVERLIKVAERAPEGREEKEAVDAIRAWFVVHTPDVAFCAGIVQYLAESAGNTRESTLRAFSVKKAMADGSADLSRGITYCRAYLARMRDAAASGEFPDPQINA
jgi:hypothetical protein